MLGFPFSGIHERLLKEPKVVLGYMAIRYKILFREKFHYFECYEFVTFETIIGRAEIENPKGIPCIMYNNINKNTFNRSPFKFGLFNSPQVVDTRQQNTIVVTRAWLLKFNTNNVKRFYLIYKKKSICALKSDPYSTLNKIKFNNSGFQNVKREIVGEKNAIICRRKEETILSFLVEKRTWEKKGSLMGE
ncbi:hypothetical protein AGLY_004362 [Aphis glycines]|uniref:Uncharacterized protein n=1 Tax=Aphis glycines TaxID=307491 RepID=A0A6G0U0B3_APHGL|nr:hypothetical protein AGLY_004362 [Aphis glycines]